MDVFSSRVKARLYKKGYQGFTQNDYNQAAIAVNVVDKNNPSKEELSKAVDYLINTQSQLAEVESSVNITLRQQEIEEEPMQDESNSGEITFGNKFEKAGAIEKVFGDNGIVASDAEMLQISGTIENTFDSEHTFMVEALTAWKTYQIANSNKQSDEIQSLLADIRTDATVHTNQINSSINATAAYINDLRVKQREQFTAFIERMKQS